MAKKNPFEGEEVHAETKAYLGVLYRQLNSFLTLSRDRYNFNHLMGSKEFTENLLKVSQNERLVPALIELQQLIDGIDINSKPDTATLKRVGELKDVVYDIFVRTI